MSWDRNVGKGNKKTRVKTGKVKRMRGVREILEEELKEREERT